MEQQESRKAVGKKMRNLNQTEREAFRAERKEEKAVMDTKIAAILTPAQLAVFHNKAAEKKGNRGRGKGKGKGKGKNKEKATPKMRAQKRADKLTKELGLDANQQAAVYNLFLKQAPRTKKGDRSELSEAEKQLLKENRQKDKAAFNAELAQILTPAQLEKFQNLPKKGKGKKKGTKNRD